MNAPRPGGVVPSTADEPGTSTPPWLRPALIGATLVLAALLLLTGLGSRAFWDDEAATALGAKAIMRTGGNTALVDYGNIVAYKDGNALVGFDNRLESLLPAYLTAASFEIFGMDTWAGRLPFALFGLGTYALLMLWARRESWQVLAVLAIASLGNISLVLYSRNCRYYAPAIFFSVALAYVYRKVRPTVGSACAFAALSILLFTSNYLNYIAFYACLGLDYLFWQRKHSPWNWRLLLWVFLPQILVNGIIGSIWNPLRTHHADDLGHTSIGGKLLLYWWQWRDMNVCEAVCLPLLIVTLGLALTKRHHLLLRGCVAMAVYVAAINVISPQVVSRSNPYADVRYLAPIIPLAIGLQSVALCLLLRRWTFPLLGVAVVTFCTNFVNGWFTITPQTRFTVASFLEELADPPPSSYALTAEWINRHVPEGQSVVVGPYFANYPLMFYAPKALYGWQFNSPARPPYTTLPPIHFKGQAAPDYLVGFGNHLDEIALKLKKMNLHGSKYLLAATIDVYWQDLDRPEIYWHLFTPATRYDPVRDTVHIYKRTDPLGSGDPAVSEPAPSP